LEVSAPPAGRSDDGGGGGGLPRQRALWLSAVSVLSSAFSLGAARRDKPEAAGTSGELLSDSGASGEEAEGWLGEASRPSREMRGGGDEASGLLPRLSDGTGSGLSGLSEGMMAGREMLRICRPGRWLWGRRPTPADPRWR